MHRYPDPLRHRIMASTLWGLSFFLIGTVLAAIVLGLGVAGVWDLDGRSAATQLGRAIMLALPGALAALAFLLAARRAFEARGLGAGLLVALGLVAGPFATVGLGSTNDFWFWLYWFLPPIAGFALRWTQRPGTPAVEQSYQRQEP